MLTADQLAKLPDFLASLKKRAEDPIACCDDAKTAVAIAEDLLSALGELNNAITWHTACLNCSSILDASYAETVRAEKAEAQLAEALAEVERLRGELEDAERVRSEVLAALWDDDGVDREDVPTLEIHLIFDRADQRLERRMNESAAARSETSVEPCPAEGSGS